MGKDVAPLYTLLMRAGLGVALGPLPGQEDEGGEAKTDLARATGEGVSGAAGRMEGLATGRRPAKFQRGLGGYGPR